MDSCATLTQGLCACLLIYLVGRPLMAVMADHVRRGERHMAGASFILALVLLLLMYGAGLLAKIPAIWR